MRKKVLIVSPVVPYPSFSGNSVRVAQLLNSLNTLDIEVHFVLCPISAISDRRDSHHMQQILGNAYTELNHGHISQGRWWQMLLDFAKKKLKLKKINVVFDFLFADGFITPRVHKEFNSLVAKIRPDVVICEYVLLSKLINDLDPSIVTLVDTHDRFAERNSRIRDAGGQGVWWSLSLEQERHLLNRFDYILAIQEGEAKLFADDLDDQHEKVKTLDIIEPALRDIYIKPEKLTIGFIGSQNKHNQQGLQEFLENHWDAIKQAIPTAQLNVAGATYPELQSENHIDVVFLGRVEDLSAFYDQSTVIINPCLTGTGLKIKSVEALSHGKPLIASPEGAEGLSFAKGKGLFVNELSSQGFARDCISLLSDEAICQNMGKQAIQVINNRFSQSMCILKTLVGI